MADPRWAFDERAHRFRDLTSGRFLPNATVTDIRERVITAGNAEARLLGEQAARGTISPEQFRAGMRDVIRNVHVSEYTFGRGGKNALTQADYGRLGGNLKQQYTFLDKFVADIAAGKQSEAQAAARAQQYVNGGHRAYEQGKATSWGIDDALPEYPGDSCEGKNYCHCDWVIIETDDAIHATWELGANSTSHCEPCVMNAARWNPLVIPR